MNADLPTSPRPDAAAPPQQAPTAAEPWWKSAVVYQIYPRSFADANGDGVGDLAGLRQRLDHLQQLGVDALWLSPIFRSPMVDAGYDVSDYRDVDPLFGGLEELDALLADAHARGMRVLLDFVPNHTSDQHPWFIESRSSRDNPKRDWYIWRDEPNGWRAALGAGSAWTLDERTGQHYLHLFLPEQPDVNWRNPQLAEAMHEVMRFWLDRGVDGFRIDVAHCVGKDPNFADHPECADGTPLSDFNDQPFSHEVLRGMRCVADAYEGERLLVGEVNIRSTAKVVEYYGEGDELHLSFNFLPLDAPWEAQAFRDCIEAVETHHGPKAAWPTWVLSNHDNRRHRSRYGGSLDRARAAAVMLLTLRGTPFLFQGEELGLEDAQVPPGQRVDPGGRDGCRAPMPWAAEPPHGWQGREPWLPFAPQAGELSAEHQWSDSGSVLHLYRRLLAARRASAALQLGAWGALHSPADMLAYRRCHGSDERVVCINFADTERHIELAGHWTVEVASDSSGEGSAFDGLLQAERAVLLRRAAPEVEV